LNTNNGLEWLNVLKNSTKRERLTTCCSSIWMRWCCQLHERTNNQRQRKEGYKTPKAKCARRDSNSRQIPLRPYSNVKKQGSQPAVRASGCAGAAAPPPPPCSPPPDVWFLVSEVPLYSKDLKLTPSAPWFLGHTVKIWVKD
jgi:hypothetical protein